MCAIPCAFLAVVLAGGRGESALPGVGEESTAVVQTTVVCPQVGDPAPDIECVDDAGRAWKLRDGLRDADYLVLFFYPGDFRFCTTRQMQKHALRSPDYAARRVRLVGVSGDSVETHQLYKQAHCLDVTLLADEDGALAAAFGVPVAAGGTTPAVDADGRQMLDSVGGMLRVEREVTLRRWTFIIDKGGTVIYRNTCVSPIADATAVLEFLDQRELAGK